MKRPITLDRFPAVLDHNDIANILGEEKEAILKQCRKGEIPAKKLGKKWIMNKKAFVQWLNGDILHKEDINEKLDTINKGINLLIEKVDFIFENKIN